MRTKSQSIIEINIEIVSGTIHIPGVGAWCPEFRFSVRHSAVQYSVARQNADIMSRPGSMPCT